MTSFRRALALGIVLVAFSASGAWGQTASSCPPPSGTADYTPTPECGLTSTTTTVSAGGTIRVQGSGFLAGSTVEFTLRSVSLGSAKTDSSGSFNTELKIPEDTPTGRHILSAAGVDPSGKPRVLSMALRVNPSAASRDRAGDRAGGALPRTGNTSVPVAVAGVALVSVGSLFLVAARRRRQGSAA